MANVYRNVKDVFAGIEAYVIGSGIDQGDMCQWDAGARQATSNLLNSGSIFLGVSETAHPMAGLGTDANPLDGFLARIRSQGIFNMQTTTGEVYSHLDPVYQGAGKQVVSLVGSTRPVGRVHLPDGTQVTGATGTPVPVRMFGSMTNCGNAPSSATTAR